ncbi:SufE family protein [Cyclobacterium xiamenense]|uniref:SufE family protein n=1 Tax=Cyclobacterium xiamenense TaxID=1297121 RepID=UPI0035D083BC
MNDIVTIQTEIIENFQLFEDWEDKYEYLLEFGSGVKPLDEIEKSDHNLVKGCQSRVWLLSEFQDDRVWYRSDGEAPIPKAIAALLVKVLSGHAPEEVVTADINFHKETGLALYLSPARVKGIESMILKFKSLAAKYLIKH